MLDVKAISKREFHQAAELSGTAACGDY